MPQASFDQLISTRGVRNMGKIANIQSRLRHSLPGAAHIPRHRRTESSSNPTVPVRHMDFGFDHATLKRYFYDDNPALSAFFMAFSSVIPQGERFFIHSVRHYRDRIQDPELQARVTGFIGQEAMHGKEHDAVNQAYERMGFPIGQLDRFTRDGLRLLSKLLPSSAQLALTVAMEHYTAMISEYVLGDAEVQAKFEKQVGDFIFWHMMEETEHKAVAYDVYEQQVGSYLLRAGIMLPGSVVLIGVLFAMQVLLMQADGTLLKPRLWRKHLQGLADLYGPRGLFARIAPKWVDYFKPGFHPNQHDTSELLARFREKFFGEKGELNPQLNKTVVPKVRNTA
jgi:predicted metal-dependent hydrolase